MTEEQSVLPISLVAHTVFCERRAWIEAVGEQVHSAQMEAGSAAHERVDRPADNLRESRSVDVVHNQMGLVGKCDVVKGESDHVVLIEYKATPVRRVPEVTRATVMQLVLQQMCLEASGVTVDEKRVYFTNHRRSVVVETVDADRGEALEWVRRTRNVIESPTAPLPLVDDPRCRSCSHVGVCLPDERRVMQGEVRRIAVSNPGGDILHLTTPGSRASIRSGRIVVHKAKEETHSVPLERVVGLVIHGNVDVSSALIREILWRGYTIVWCSGNGRVVGHARSTKSPNAVARVRQHVLSESGHLDLARELIACKVANQATQLRRNARIAVHSEVAEMRKIARRVSTAHSVPEILGLEGEAAAIYFGRLQQCLASDADTGFAAGWSGRTGRHAGDPVNVALNYAYSLLLADCIRALHACGLDPHAGFVHSPVRNKPALALDLMEQFRPVVADSAVLAAINTGKLTTADFSTEVSGLPRLTPTGRRAVTSEYRRRVAQQFTHPRYGYKVTWQRAFEVQARMILGILDGTDDTYVGIRTR
ncbi:CRISPR-associated endonuclease Cas1 [Gordonia sp. NPDC003376]